MSFARILLNMSAGTQTPYTHPPTTCKCPGRGSANFPKYYKCQKPWTLFLISAILSESVLLKCYILYHTSNKYYHDKLSDLQYMQYAIN